MPDAPFDIKRDSVLVVESIECIVEASGLVDRGIGVVFLVEHRQLAAVVPGSPVEGA